MENKNQNIDLTVGDENPVNRISKEKGLFLSHKELNTIKVVLNSCSDKMLKKNKTLASWAKEVVRGIRKKEKEEIK